MEAWGGAAADARDDGRLADARRAYALAIGCAEAGGARRLGASYLGRFARMEVAVGDAQAAVTMCHQAMRRLDGVPLMFARLDEANVMETLGDAWSRLGDRDRAAVCWRDALARQERLQRTNAVARLREKLRPV
jgi:hypothetical protein